MVALLVPFFVIVLLAVAVLLFAAGPARGRDVPGAPGLADRVSRVLPEETSPGYGVLSSPAATRRAQRRFERAEDAVLRWLPAGAGKLGSVRSGGTGAPRHRS